MKAVVRFSLLGMELNHHHFVCLYGEGENYCRMIGIDLNVYVTDWFPTGAAPATTVQGARRRAE